MNNKEKIFLASLQETIKEFLKGDIGRAAKTDLAQNENVLKAIEKANGGAKKLANAGLEAAKVLNQAHVSAEAFASSAVTDAKVARAEIDAEKQRLSTDQAGLAKALEALAVQSQELEAGNKAFRAHELDLIDRGQELDRQQAEVVARENAVTVRESDIKRKDDYYAGAPA